VLRCTAFYPNTKVTIAVAIMWAGLSSR